MIVYLRNSCFCLFFFRKFQPFWMNIKLKRYIFYFKQNSIHRMIILLNYTFNKSLIKIFFTFLIIFALNEALPHLLENSANITIINMWNMQKSLLLQLHNKKFPWESLTCFGQARKWFIHKHKNRWMFCLYQRM